MTGLRIASSVAAGLMALTCGCAGAEEPSAGASLFATRCGDCHDAVQGVTKKGPTLKGVVGRTAGTVPDFAYSDAMKAAGFVWDAEKLSAYMLNPKAVVPGNRMMFNGLKREGELEVLLAYLAEVSQ